MFEKYLSTFKKALLIDAVTSIIVAILMLLLPDKTVMLFAIIVGITFIFIGGVTAVLFIKFHQDGFLVGVSQAVISVLYVVAGVFMLFNIRLASVTLIGVLATIVGITWMFDGMLQMFTLSSYESGKFLLVIQSIINIVAGVVLMISPISGGIILWLIVGVFILINGITKMIRYWMIR
ncbi:DUF308 domain-containing protein [Weissella confusa]|uniref:HdeD family acid-resistance protein n=1 Tax=Weissella confusa TaxID=1583 RepID=UPI002A74BBF5|nr:DUF308 domain-containing protein [Weissella confusa]MDY2529882.1 DUF308 domain-containing protein [Weissella confusa]